MEKEKVKFDIQLSGTYWDKIPEFSIGIDNQEVIKDSVTDSQVFSFTVDLTEEEHVLWIDFLNKTDEDVKKDQYEDPINFEILADMILNIEKISIDDIEIEILKWDASEFIPKNPKKEILKKCVNLGCNGRYQIKFTSPVYLWLLENL